MEFEIWDRYTNPKFVGQGAYGCVIFCHDNVLNCEVAVKKVVDIHYFELSP